MEVQAREEDGPPQTDPATVKVAGTRLFWGIIGQIAIIDIVFSLDSVITAVGMVDQIGVMVAAVVTSVGVMPEAFEAHVPKGYIYAAMSFSLVVEALNIRARKMRLAAAAGSK